MIGNLLVDDPTGGVPLELGCKMARSLGLGLSLLTLLNLLLVELNIVMLQVPLSKCTCIDGDDAVLDDGLSSYKLVVGSVIDNI